MENLTEIKDMVAINCISSVLVLLAISVDLACGLRKARQRGEERSSSGLKRSVTKFITYEGGILIAGAVDVMVSFCKLPTLLGVETLCGVPFVTCLLTIFLLAVEGLSVRESADKKTKTEMARVAELASLMVRKEDIVEAITKAVAGSLKSKGGGDDGDGGAD